MHLLTGGDLLQVFFCLFFVVKASEALFFILDEFLKRAHCCEGDAGS